MKGTRILHHFPVFPKAHFQTRVFEKHGDVFLADCKPTDILFGDVDFLHQLGSGAQGQLLVDPDLLGEEDVDVLAEGGQSEHLLGAWQ